MGSLDSQASCGAMKSNTILIVSDDKAARWLLERQLQKLQARTESVFSGAEAVSRSVMHSYGFILLNTKLAGLNGVETVQEIRRLEGVMKKRRVPIIAVSRPEDDESALRQAGFDDQFLTPLSIDDLQRILSKWLPINEGERPTAGV